VPVPGTMEAKINGRSVEAGVQQSGLPQPAAHLLERLANARIAPDVRQLLSGQLDENITAIAMRGISELLSEGLFQFHVFIERKGSPNSGPEMGIL
jgi:hypothetical protein